MRNANDNKTVYAHIAAESLEEMNTLCGPGNINLNTAAEQTGARVTRLGDEQVVVNGHPAAVSRVMGILTPKL